MEASIQNILEIFNSDSLKKIPVDNEIIPKDGRDNAKGGTQMDSIVPTEHMAKEIVLVSNFFRGKFQDLLTISHDDEAVWEEDNSNANWILVGKGRNVVKKMRRILIKKIIRNG